MNKLTKIGIALICLLINCNLFGQNPNWTLPPNQFNGSTFLLNPLPQAQTGGYTYTGQPADNMHSSYSDQNGNLVLFTVDQRVYDRHGYLVDEMQENLVLKRGHNERLILPMGNDCSRYAILYPASPTSDESYSSKLDGRRLYMGVYDLDAVNTANPMASGALEVYDPNSYSTIKDISKRDAMLYGYPAGGSQNIYQFDSGGQQFYRSNIQIAATDLIDNCFYYIFVFDGYHIIRYKLTSNDLEYDNYVFDISQSQFGSDLRSEMEIIKLSNGNYRMATPMLYGGTGNHVGFNIVDIDASTGDIINNSLQFISLEINGSGANPHGAEFDPTGRYLYITHAANAGLPNALDVYDLNTLSYVSIPTLTGIGNYRRSFIERYGDKMYLASDSYIGQLSNISSPGSLSFNSTFLSIPSGYGNAYGGPSTHFDFRYILPDQVDMPYANLAEMSCECCSRFNTAHDKYEASNTISETWSPGSNPFGSVSGNVYISDELRIKAGAKVIISGMNFFFAEGAKVVVERGTTSLSGGYLRLSNSTVFTADNRCSNSSIASCGVSDNCDKILWTGVLVQGNDALPQSLSSSSKQGQFYMTNNSMIEYAETAVFAGGPANYGGGLVQIVDSRIKDNLSGVIFDPYTRYQSGSIEGYNLSYIAKTHFMVTSDWYAGVAVKPFVKINKSSGIRLLGNLYENQIPSQFSYTKQGIGVQFTDSRVSITASCSSNTIPCPPQNIARSQFKDLHVGVYGTNTGKTTRTLYCNYNEFTNNYFGIQLSGVDYTEILDNDFKIRPRSGAIGLSLNASTGYMVENNNFSTYNGGFDYGNYGIVVQNSGQTANEIYRNYFTDLSVGGYAIGVNTDMSHGASGYANGLQWLCNTFDPKIGSFDIALKGSMGDEQGDCNTEPAGNLFSHSSTSISSHFDLFSDPSSLNPIKYYHHDTWVAGTSPRVKPLKYSEDIVAPIYYYIPAICNGFGYDGGSCRVKHSGLPPGVDHPLGSAKSNTDDVLLNYQSIQENAAALQDQISDLKSQLDGGNTELLLNLIYEGGSVDEISALLAEANGNISTKVQSALLNSNNEEVNLLIDEEQNDVSLIESELAIAEELHKSLWQNTVRQYMADTLGTILKEEMEALMIEFQPESMERFASVILPASQQGWISPSNKTQTVANIDVALPAFEENGLPKYIPSYFESDFFESAANTDALNTWYYENDAVYYVSLPDPEWPPMIYGEGKSNKTDKELVDDTKNKLVVHPNPFKTFTSFDLSAYEFEGDNNRIEFYDLLGKKVFETSIAEKQVNLTVQSADLPTGVVIYKLFVNNTALETGKIISVK